MEKKTALEILGSPVGFLPQQRYCIKSDGSHKYFVRVEDAVNFEVWVKYYESGGEVEYHGPAFDSNRIDGRFTFTDPRNG